MSAVLSLTGINTFYGPIQALRDVSMDVNEGEIVTLIGANGAGKSTLMMTICGNPRAKSGSIIYRGELPGGRLRNRRRGGGFSPA